MKTSKFAFLFLLPFAVLGSQAQASVQDAREREFLRVVSHQRIVMFREGVSRKLMEKAVKDAGGTPVRHIGLINAVVAYFETDTSKELLNHPGVAEVAEDGVAYMIGSQEPKPQPVQSTPWGIERIRASGKWEATKGKSTLVCVIDSGIQTAHPDLAGLTAGGENLLDSAKSIEDEIDHGTHVSGTIAALNNEIGVVGVNPYGSKIFAAKVFGNEGRTSWSTVAAAIDSCVRNKTRVINMSLGGSSDNSAIAASVKKAYEAGLVIVAAAGNNNGKVSYPAAYSEVIAVAASDKNDKRAYFSNYGKEVDYIAPGVGIPSTITGSAYDSFSGTSMASPHVAGAVALILALQPGLNPAGVVQVLDTCATDIKLVAEEQGRGLLDLGKDTCTVGRLESGLASLEHRMRLNQIKMQRMNQAQLKEDIQKTFGN